MAETVASASPRTASRAAFLIVGLWLSSWAAMPRNAARAAVSSMSHTTEPISHSLGPRKPYSAMKDVHAAGLGSGPSRDISHKARAGRALSTGRSLVRMSAASSGLPTAAQTVPTAPAGIML